MQTRCDIEECELDGEDGRAVRSVRATCSRCDNQTESYGRSSSSIRRCLVLMREECPRAQKNYYVADEDDLE